MLILLRLFVILGMDYGALQKSHFVEALSGLRLDGNSLEAMAMLDTTEALFI